MGVWPSQVPAHSRLELETQAACRSLQSLVVQRHVMGPVPGALTPNLLSQQRSAP